MRKKILTLILTLFLLGTPFVFCPTGNASGTLTIDAPVFVNESEEFTVTVSRDGTPAEGVSILFNGEYNYTDENGQVFLIAPTVNQDTNYSITAKGSLGQMDEVAWVIVKDVSGPIIEKPLSLTVPSSVTEGVGFDVVVSADGMLIEGAAVEFNGLRQITHENGLVRFIAPLVSENTEYLVRATMQGYIAVNTNITVVNQEAEEPLGWISGTVTNTSGSTLEGVIVCVNLVGETDTTCIQTTGQGEYILSVAPGEYTVKASKQGYENESVSPIIVTDDNETIVNIILTLIPPPPPEDEQIEDAIAEGRIGAEISIFQNESGQIQVNKTIYGNITINSSIGDKTITFTVGGEHQKTGQTIRFTFDTQVMQLETGNFVVMYDGEQIGTADDFLDVVNTTDDGTKCEYYFNSTADNKTVWVSVPVFSTHTITISSVIIETLSTLTIIGLYVLFAVLIGVLLVSPAVASGVYHTFKRKKNK